MKHGENLVPKFGVHLLDEFAPDSGVGDIALDFKLVEGREGVQKGVASVKGYFNHKSPPRNNENKYKNKIK